MRNRKAVAAFCALALGLSASGAGLEKYLFWKDTIGSDAAVEKFKSVIKRAAAAGYTKVVLGAGIDYSAKWSESRQSYFAQAAESIRENGLEVVAGVWSFGYGAMLNYGYDLIEGAPIEDTTYVVSGGEAVFRPDVPETPYVSDGGFENHPGKRFSDWTYIDGDGEQWCFQDREVKHGGEASLRMEYPGEGHAMRVSQSVTPRANRLYRFSAWVKTRDLAIEGDYGLTLFVQREGQTGKPSFTSVNSGIRGTTDWTKVSIDFNSSDYGTVRLWIKASKVTGGCYWVDDVTLEEVPPPCVIHSDGTPITVKNAATGAVYEEGKDFELSKLVYKEWTSASDRIRMTIPEGSAIPEGAELSVTWYSPAAAGDGADQISICPCHTRLAEVMADSVAHVQELCQPTEWLLSFDEWRNGNHCALCRAQATTLPQKIAALAASARDIIHEANPSAKVWIWSDMFSPDENAVDCYYNVRGSCLDGARHLPADIGVACWGNASKAADIVSLFQAGGHETLAAAFYDESAELDGTRNWLAAASENAGCRAIMYTTWKGDYGLMEDFAQTVDGTVSALYPSGGRTCFWTGAEDGRWNNARNWRGGWIPGVIWDGQTDDPGLPSGDTAVFGACATGNTTIDLEGLYSIHFVKVTGADAAKYTFGLDTTQTLGLETNGCFCVEASVAAENAPVVNANLAHTANYDYAWKGKASTGITTYYTNACPGRVVINGKFGTRVLRPGSKTDYAEWGVVVHNVGGLEFNAEAKSSGYLYSYDFYGNGSYWYNASALQHKKLIYHGTTTINLAKDVLFGTYNGNSIVVQPVACTVTIEGEGSFRVSDYGANRSVSNRGYLSLSSGRLVVRCPLVPNPEKTADLILYSGSNGLKGTLDLTDCPTNGFSKRLIFLGYGNLEISDLVQLGGISEVRIEKYGTNINRIDWSGAAETFSLPVCYTNAGDFAFRNLGSDALTVTSVATAEVANAILGLNGEKSPVIYAGTLAGDTPPQLRVTGEVTISDVANLGESAAVSLKDGVLTLGGKGSRAFAKGLVSESGANVIRLAAGDVITVPSIAVTKGTLDLQAGRSGGRLVVSGATSATKMPAGVLYNGVPAAFDDSGRIIGKQTAPDVRIAAKGDTVPDNGAATVAITSEGSGADTSLAADATAVKALVQQQAAAATIAVGAGQVLTVGEVAIDDGWGDLTVGGTAGVGTLAASGALTLRNDATAALTVNAKLGGPGLLNTGAGEVVLKGGTATGLVGVTNVTGTLRLAAGEYETADDSALIAVNGGRMIVGDGVYLHRHDNKAASGNARDSQFQVGYAGPGVLEIEDGAVISNRITTARTQNTGNQTGSCGAVYQHGGYVYNTPGASSDLLMVGGRGYAYGFWGIDGGTLEFDKEVYVGSSQGVGVFQMTGGTVRHLTSGNLRMTNTGKGVSTWYQCGGTAALRGLQLPQATANGDRRTCVTVEGAGTVLSGTGNMDVGGHNLVNAANTNSFQWVNVNRGARVIVNGITRDGRHLAPVSRDLRDTNKVFVNFDGGILQGRATWGTDLFGNLMNGGTTGVDRVTVYGGGLTVCMDTGTGTGNSGSVRVPITGATGNGVKSVEWIDRDDLGMVGPPFVEIIGDGEGASAYAYFDTTLGKVTEVRVTSPGVDYTWAKAVFTYRSTYSGSRKDWTNEVTLARNETDGGLTVDGPGPVYLYATNTYVGPTVVRRGTLYLANNDVVNPASRLVLEKDGTLDMFASNRRQTFSDITCNGGTILRAKPSVSGLIVDFDMARAGSVKKVDLALCTLTDGAALSLENFDASKLEEGGRYVLVEFANGVPTDTLDLAAVQAMLPEGWKVKFVGNRIVLKAVMGMTVIVR